MFAWILRLGTTFLNCLTILSLDSGSVSCSNVSCNQHFLKFYVSYANSKFFKGFNRLDLGTKCKQNEPLKEYMFVMRNPKFNPIMSEQWFSAESIIVLGLPKQPQKGIWNLKPSVFIHPIDPKPFEDIHQRVEIIQKEGWGKMPGQEKVDYTVSLSCTDGIDLLVKNEQATKGNSYVGYLFNKKGRCFRHFRENHRRGKTLLARNIWWTIGNYWIKCFLKGKGE